jgi:hypothetical protein
MCGVKLVTKSIVLHLSCLDYVNNAERAPLICQDPCMTSLSTEKDQQEGYQGRNRHAGGSHRVSTVYIFGLVFYSLFFYHLFLVPKEDFVLPGSDSD